MTIKPPTQVFEFSAKVPDGDRIDAQFADHAAAINSISRAIEDVRRSDGALRNHIVTADTLDPKLVEGILQDLQNAFQSSLDSLHAHTRNALKAAADAAEARDATLAAAIRAKTAQEAIDGGANTALAAAAEALALITAAQIRAEEALPTISNAENDALAAAATAQDWAIVSHDWAEYMGGPGDQTIPPNTLAIMGLSGDHWSARWWANKGNEYAQSAEDSAIAAAGSAEDAATSAEEAAGSAESAAEHWDEFNDLYLGTFPSAPTTDNDGDALQEGALYFDSTFDTMLVWNGTSWQGFSGATLASDVSFVPAGTIQSTDVQAALEELDSDIQNLNAGGGDIYNKAQADARFVNVTGDTMTGTLAFNYVNPLITMTKTASGQASQIVGRAVNASRWTLSLGSGATEPGDGSGSNFVIVRHNDAGTALDNPISVDRLYGRVTIPNSVAIGGSPTGSDSLRVTKTITGATVAYGIISNGTVQSDVTAAGIYYRTAATTAAATFTTGGIHHYSAAQGAFGAGSTVSAQYGFNAEASLIGATNNYGFIGNIPAGTGRWNFYAGGTARNFMQGQLSIGATTDPGTGGLFVAGNATTGKLTVNGPAAATGTYTANLRTPGAVNSEQPDLAFYATFGGSIGDLGQRRVADIYAGFGNAWNTEYLAFGVGNGGASNDTQNVTTEKLRIIGDGSGNAIFTGAGALHVHTGTTAQRPSTPALAGMMRFNTTSSQFEGYNGTTWGAFGGALITDVPPPNAGPGEFWWESDTGALYICYRDPDGTQQWVQTNASSNILEAPIDGFLYGRTSGGWASGGVTKGNLGVASNDPLLVVNKTTTAGGHGAGLLGQVNGKHRWVIYTGDGATESGSNTGSDFSIARYNDAGTTYLGSALNINRATGNITTSGAIQTGGNVNVGTSTFGLFAGGTQNYIQFYPNYFITVTQSTGVMTVSAPSGLTLAGPTTVSGNLSVTGTYTVSGAITSGSSITANQNFVSSTAAVVLAPTGAGTVYLRPNGSGNGSGQATVASNGNFTAAGLISTGGISAGTNIYAAADITTPSFVRGSAGVYANSAFIADSGNAILAATGTGMVYLRPNGVSSGAGQAFLDATGMFRTSSVRGDILYTAGSVVHSDIAQLILAAASGPIYLRPYGSGSAAYETRIDSNGLTTEGSIRAAASISTTHGVFGGFQGKNGASGAIGGNNFNFLWNGSYLYGFVDDVNLGIVSFISDHRVKKDVTDLPSTWETVKKYRPVKYTHKDYWASPVEDSTGKTQDVSKPLVVGDDVERWGFIAHELQDATVPSASTGIKDEANALQSPNPWTIIAALTKTIQEMQVRIEALEAAQ